MSLADDARRVLRRSLDAEVRAVAEDCDDPATHRLYVAPEQERLCRILGHRWTVWMKWGTSSQKRSCFRCRVTEDRLVAPDQEK